MISYLQGKILKKTDRAVILQAGQIGFLVYSTEKTLAKIKLGQANVKLFCHLSVQEYQMNLFGFLSYQELTCFQYLISVSGVGPRMALNLLDCASVPAIEQAIISSDIKFLSQAKGVGQKLAQRIIMELGPKLKNATVGTVGTRRGAFLQKDKAALSALMALGYKKTEAQAALKQVPAELRTIDQRVKEALKLLGR